MLRLDYQEVSTVLAALRMLQEAIESEPEAVLEMSHFVDCDPLSIEQIDELCHRINFAYSEQDGNEAS